MSLVLRSVKGSKLTIAEMDGNLTYLESLGIGITGATGATGTGAGITEVTYSELTSLISGSSLLPGSFYKITDFRTCYDQPNYDLSGSPILTDNYKQASISPIVVLTTSENTLAIDAWQPEYPNDKIKYDVSWTATEHTGGTAYGRITERIDEWNNRTDYDHRTVLFKRYLTYEYDPGSPLAGTVSLSNGTLTGVGTNFTSLFTDDIIAIPSIDERFFKITTIISDTEMYLTGSNVAGSYPDRQYYSTSTLNYISYKQNNVDPSFTEYTTFGDAIDSSLAINNWIGDHAQPYLNANQGQFLLANNVFLSGEYRNNRFGNSCYNNTFDDDCTNNTIGNFFFNNITNDDFDSNYISNFFSNNIITANFNENQIGHSFEYNFIVNFNFNANIVGAEFSNNDFAYEYDFNNNYILNSFRYNNVFADFQLNQIGNNFGDNYIKLTFEKNKIAENFNNNSVYSFFNDNEIGNRFEQNTLGEFSNTGEFSQNKVGNLVKSNLFLGYNNLNSYGDNFYSNQIGDNANGNKFGVYCIYNTIGENFDDNAIGNNFYENNIAYDFKHNTIGHYFNNNTIEHTFAYNKIGNNFYDNNIKHDFGFGGLEVYGNVIGNYFYNNNIGEYFYSNNIQDLFNTNSIGNYFQFNDVKVQNLSGYDFTQYLGNIVSIADNTGLSPSIPGTNGTYSGLTASYNSGSFTGYNATFDVVVSGSVVISVTVSVAGNEYHTGDQLIIVGSKFGGSNGTDIVIDILSISNTPPVYGNYNCTIFRNADSANRLSYYDTNDVLTINTSLIQ